MAKKYGANRSFDREEPMFSAINRSRSDANYHSNKVEKSLPRKKDIRPIFIDSNESANKSLRKPQRVETPKSTELNGFMRPILVDVLPDESLQHQNEIGMVSVANISLEDPRSMHGTTKKHTKVEERMPSMVRMHTEGKHNTSHSVERMDEVLERSMSSH